MKRNAKQVAQLVLELLQDDLRITDPPTGDPDCADLIVRDDTGAELYLIRITDLQAGDEGNLHDCVHDT